MERTFSRKISASVIFMILSILTLIGGMRHSEYRLIPELAYYIGAGFIFIYSMWKFMVPYAVVDTNFIIIKRSPFETEEIVIKDIRKIDYSEDEVQLTLVSSLITINIKAMGEDNREEFIEVLKNFRLDRQIA